MLSGSNTLLKANLRGSELLQPRRREDEGRLNGQSIDYVRPSQPDRTERPGYLKRVILAPTGATNTVDSQHSDLVYNPLCDGQPVQRDTECRRDMVAVIDVRWVAFA